MDPPRCSSKKPFVESPRRATYIQERVVHVMKDASKKAPIEFPNDVAQQAQVFALSIPSR